jgi:hypothetical protein
VAGGTECRGSAGICDLGESCDGLSPDCPDEAFVAAGTECRSPAGICDALEACDGASAFCPDDDPDALDGEICDDGLPWTEGDACRAGACTGLELGSCAETLTIDTLPFVHESATTDRPSHLDSYGEGCGEASSPGPDVVYEVEGRRGERLSITLDPTDGFDAALVVLTGACRNDEPCSAWSDEGRSGESEAVGLTFDHDETLLIVVESSDGSEGGYLLTIEAIESVDGDADADFDDDPDADEDTDFDADADADADADEDRDIDPDWDGDADTDADFDTSPDADSDADSDEPEVEDADDANEPDCDQDAELDDQDNPDEGCSCRAVVGRLSRHRLFDLLTP